MKIIPLDTPTLLENYHTFLSNHPEASLWQSPEWGNFQTKIGRKSFLLGAFDPTHRSDPTSPGELLATAQVIEHPLKFGYKYWYLPRGPLWLDDRAVGSLLQELTLRARQAKVLFIQTDPFVNLPVTIPTIPATTSQPRHTLILNLHKTTDQLLSEMKPKGRYNINLAERKGVQIKKTAKANNFFKLLQTTTQRDGFTGWGRPYYQKMLDTLSDNALLLEAYHENDLLGAGIFTFTNKKAVYYYGASGNKKRNLMAPYLLQWHAIQEAQKRHCTEYDFLGISPDTDPHHPWAGVTQFKTKFGGEKITHPTPSQITTRPILTHLYILAKKTKQILSR